MRRLATALIATALLYAIVPGAVAAKEGMTVAFDAPIALDTPPGTELLVGMTVTMLDEDGEHPVQGSPIVLVLAGRAGATTEARGIQDTLGHYTMRIAIPPGGVQGAQVVLRGSSSNGPADFELELTTDPFTSGGVTETTAQVAPAPTPVLTPAPRATAVPPAAVAAAPAPAPGSPAAATSPETGTWWAPALVLVLLGLAVVIAVRLRAGRRAAQGT
jgi:hypothetical protein